MAKISRRKIAAYIANELIAGRDIVKQLAAYLIDTKREGEVALIVRDIESALAERGVLFADIASSRPLVDEVERSIAGYLKKSTGASDVRLRKHVDEELLGGVRIDTPDARLDATLRHRLNQILAAKLG